MSRSDKLAEIYEVHGEKLRYLIVGVCNTAVSYAMFLTLLAVVGPRRGILAGSSLHPYFAVPHGDMMLAGCFGCLRALARKRPEWRPSIEQALDRGAV